MRYRCHPNFGNNGHYYDWTLVKYDDGNDFPCKLIVIIPGVYNQFEGYHLIVQEAKKKLKSGSVLFVDYKFSPELRIIDADTVNGPCFVIESDSNKQTVALAKESETWAGSFTNLFAEDS